MIVAMLRVKNEARWIGEVLTALKPVSEKIIVMDDHSTDATVEICREHGAIVYNSPFQGLDEARDKDWLLKCVGDLCPPGTWVLCIDGDEVISEKSVDAVIALAGRPEAAFSFRIRYLWDRRDQIRVDGVYGSFRRPSMFRFMPGQTFKRTGAAGNFHCSSVPSNCISAIAPADVDLLHLGYMDQSDRLRKYEWYVARDGGNAAEDGYRHIVVGDVFPADAAFRHGGPLKLEALNA